MGLREVKEQSRRVRRRVIETLPTSDRITGRVVLGAVVGALIIVIVWGLLFYYVDKISFTVPSPMYIFVITKIFFVLLLLFILCSMIWSCLESSSKEHIK